MISQQTIKAENKKRLYQLISGNSGISRACLASVTSLSKTTVSFLIEELIQEGRIVDQGSIESGRKGRRPNSLSVNSRDCVIVLNWRRHEIWLSLVSAAFEIEAQERESAEPETLGAKALAEKILSFIRRYTEDRSVLGICITVPGMIDSARHQIISMVLALSEEGLIDEIRRMIPEYPISFLNDTACMAYAEQAFGEMEEDSYLYVNINEGIGASLVQNSRILHGGTGMGTQLGHFSIDRNGKKCRCGNRGCLENRIGELALPERILENDLNIPLPGKEEGSRILFRDIGQMAGEGNGEAEKLIKILASDLSFALGNFITVLHPDSVVIGGMARKLGETFLEEIISDLKETGFRFFLDNLDIRFAGLGEEAILTGAARYYIDTHYNFQEDLTGKLFLG